jgi:hypothetical protein
MESIVPVLIGVAFVILQAIASSNKKKEAARRRTATPSQPQPYTRPQPPVAEPLNPFEELLRKLQAPAPQENSSEEAYDEEEEEKGVQNLEKALYPQYRQPPIAPLQTVQNTLERIEREEKAAAALIPAPVESEWNSETFDLRKAVIYSEILQPKY